MKASTTIFTSLFVLLAGLKAVSGQFAGMPECGSTCVQNVSKDKNCADTACVCAEQPAIMNCIYRTCPVEDRAGSAYFVREGCSNAPPAPAPAPSSSAASSSASASSSATSSSTSSRAASEEPEESSTGAPATPGTPTSATNTSPAATTAPGTRNVASPTEPTPTRMVRSSSSASRASTTVVIQTIGANAGDDETGLLGAATSVKAGMMGYAGAILAMGVGAFLL